jgi:hypothetical protein
MRQLQKERVCEAGKRIRRTTLSFNTKNDKLRCTGSLLPNVNAVNLFLSSSELRLCDGFVLRSYRLALGGCNGRICRGVVLQELIELLERLLVLVQNFEVVDGGGGLNRVKL